MTTLHLDTTKPPVVLYTGRGESEPVEYVAPIANLNGQDVKSLYYENLLVVKKLDETMAMLAGAAPHGRDFQISPAGDFEKARALFEESMHTLRKLRLRYEAIADALCGQMP